MTSGNTAAKAVLYMKKGVPNKIIELIAADRKPLKKMKLAVDCKSTDELVADKVFSEMEQTVVIIGGGADGIIELEGFVATLCTLPRWLQMFILAYKPEGAAQRRGQVEWMAYGNHVARARRHAALPRL